MPKILIIDDERLLLEEICDALMLAGYVVCMSESAMQGIHVACQEKPDLILSDVMMPEVSGYELIQQIRQIPDIAQIPVVFMTAAADLRSMRHAMSLGADDYIAKPFTMQELIGSIDTRLKRHQEILLQQKDEIEVAKRQLMSMVSHELRTPLVSIMGVSELIEQELHQLEPDEVQQLLQVLTRGSQRLHRVTEKIIILTQIESGLMKNAVWHQTPFRILLHNAIDASRQFARQNHLVIHVPEWLPEVSIQCHQDLLTHALAELFANALTFSNPDGEIHVRVAQHQQWVELCIRDYGRGMAQDDLQKVIQPFQQIDRNIYEQQGVGLGLTLASRVIEQHHGQLHLYSEPNQGTEVTVLLPIAGSR